MSCKDFTQALQYANILIRYLWSLSNMPKKVLIALPPAMLSTIDFIAEAEHRTRSDLIREALRRYMDNFKRNVAPSMHIHRLETGEEVALIEAN